jgi:hypothetical protein
MRISPKWFLRTHFSDTRLSTHLKHTQIIFPYDVTKDGYTLKNEREFKKEFPKAYKYLASRRARLESRKDFQQWYAFSAPRNLNVHDSAHLLVPLLANQGSYAQLPRNRNHYCLMASGGFSISIKEGELSLYYVLGLLNSTLLFWKLKQISNIFRGGWITCTKQYVGQLPIRTINFADAADRQKHDAVVALVEEMLQLRKDHAHAEREKLDTRHTLQARIAQVDKQIDALVYQLYELTAEEIKVVEGR